MNRVYFINHAEHQPIPLGTNVGSWLLGAHVQLPILWLALFDKQNLHYVKVPFSDKEGNELIQDVPTFFAPTQEALDRYDSRKERLCRALPQQYAPYILEWETFLAHHLSQPFVQIECTELWMMDQPEYFLENVTIYLEAIDDPDSESWSELCQQACLSDPDVARYGLRGFPWQISLHWE